MQSYRAGCDQSEIKPLKHLVYIFSSLIFLEVAGVDSRATQPGCTKMAISQLFLGVASSNLAGIKSKCHLITKFSFLLSIRLCWRKIRPDTSETTESEFVASFL